MINKFITFFIFCSLSLSVTPALTQPALVNGYSIEHFTDENGLPQNSINAALFDDKGFLWLGSQVGLIRYDGRSFQLYYPDDKPIMESNVTLLGKNSQGAIYFQTDDHNLYCYPGNNSHLLSAVNTSALKRPYLLNTRKKVFDFTHFLQATPSDVDAEKKQLIFRDLFENNDNFYPIDSLHTYLFYRDTLYYYDDHSLRKIGDPFANSNLYLTLDGKFYSLNGDSVFHVYEDGEKIQGAVLMEGDLAKDRRVTDGKSRLPFRLFSSGMSNHLLAGSRLYDIYLDRKGALTTRFLTSLDYINNITGIAYSPEFDLLVITSNTDGFYFLRKSKFLVNAFPPLLQQKLSQHLFGPLALRGGNQILTNQFIFNAAGKFVLVKDSLLPVQKGLYIDKKDNVWGAIYNLPRKLTADLKPVKVFQALDAPIVDYKEDEKGDLYCLTEKSLWRLEGDRFQLLFNSSQLSVNGATESLNLVGSQRFWIAHNNGVAEADLRNRSVKSIPLPSGTHVRAIHVCRDGSILLGTYGQGYYYYHRSRFFKMPLDRNGFLITAHCFLEDKEENIWISSNKGLFRTPKADMDSWCDSGDHPLYYYYFGKQDGLLTNEFNGGFNQSGVITRDGFAVLLSMKGIVCFHTDSLQAGFPKGKIDMSEIEIDGKSAPKTDSIELPADYNSLLVEISCPFLGNRNNLHLEYCLKGLSEEWKEVPGEGIVNLSRLEPGHYSLQVRKLNGFGKNNYQYRQWNITVIPHFYRTTWFVLLASLVLALLLFLLVQLRWKLIEKQKEVSVKAEKLKGAVVTLEDTVTKLQESEKALLQSSQSREKLISLVIHDLRSPLRFLTMLASDLHDNQAGLSMEEIKERAYWVKKGANDIYHFSEDFLLWVTSQKDNFNATRRLFPIRPLLQEIHDFFLDQVQQKGNSLTYDAADKLSIDSDPHILITIIRNLVDNANKYTNQGKISIVAREEEGQLVIAVTDTGQGMSRKQMDAFLKNEDVEGIRSGSQLGHKFILDLSRRIDGILTIESREKEGTTVKIRFRS
jgi:signal transduction histidine kinase